MHKGSTALIHPQKRPHNLNGGRKPTVNFVSPPEPMTVVELRQIRRKLGYTTKQMAYALGFGDSGYRTIERNKEVRLPIAMAVRYYLQNLVVVTEAPTDQPDQKLTRGSRGGGNERTNAWLDNPRQWRQNNVHSQY